MSDASDSLRPYSFNLSGDMHYVFTTEGGVVYHAYFIDFSMYAPQFRDVYMFNIEPEGDTTNQPQDIRISQYNCNDSLPFLCQSSECDDNGV